MTSSTSDLNPYTPEAERALLDLIALNDPIEQTLLAARRLYGNGPEGGPVAVLGPGNVLAALERWEDGRVSSEEVHSWARQLWLHAAALVHRPYLSFEIGHQRGIADAIGKLAHKDSWPYSGTLIRLLKHRMEMTDAEADEHARRYL